MGVEKFGKSRSVVRGEDVRFLTGHGEYISDTAPDDALVCYVLRSPVAHGDISQLDPSDAIGIDGVHLIFTADDLKSDGVDIAMPSTVVANQDGSMGAQPLRPILAQGRVRHVGEAIAMIVADSIEAAKDAAEAIVLEIEDRDVHTTLQIGGAQIHDEAPDNIAFDFAMGDEAAVEAQLARAAHIVTLEVPDNRVIINSMEPRGCWADMEAGRLHLAFSGQGVWGMKRNLAQHFQMPVDDIRVTNPDVGGGFGMKAMSYPEYVCVAYAARKLGRAVKWTPDRTESMLSDHAGRDLTSTATLGFDADHKIVAYKVTSIANMGAYNSQYGQPIQTELFSKVFTGVYDIPNAWMQCTGIYTNTTIVDAYRGAGRPEAIYVMERALDHAAGVLGVDGLTLRRKNFIAPNQFPYETAAGVLYDHCEFDRVLTRVTQESDVAGFADRKAAAAQRGKLMGQGLCVYVESILGASDEHARIVLEPDNRATIYVGTQSNGQGHETVYAQYFADLTGIDPERITIVQGDSDKIPTGGGTGGSRSVTIQGSAILETTEGIIATFQEFLTDQNDGAPVSFDGEVFRIDGSNLVLGLFEVADLMREAGKASLLDQTAKVTQELKSFPNGAHVCEVEIDPQTGQTQVVRYTVTDDFGNLINPMLVEGQVHGGIAQGIGQILMEQTAFDSEGQLLSASFMDYAMPRADMMPDVKFTNEVIASTRNPLGMKGCGEAGTIGALAAVTNAVYDAVAVYGVTQINLPMTPQNVWAALNPR